MDVYRQLCITTRHQISLSDISHFNPNDSDFYFRPPKTGYHSTLQAIDVGVIAAFKQDDSDISQSHLYSLNIIPLLQAY